MYSESTIKELVEGNKLYHILNDKLDINLNDYHKTFPQICSEKKMDYLFIEKLLKIYDETLIFPFDELNDCCLNELLSYLKKSHVFYLQKKLPEIEQTSIQVFKKYNDSHPLLAYMCMFFSEYKKHLIKHIAYEEKKLFPYISKLLKADFENWSVENTLNLLNEFSTREFLSQHSNVEDELTEVRKVILNSTAQSKTPLPYNVLINQLHYFEIELTKHAIIEDEVLIPKVIELEAHLLKKVAHHSSQKHFKQHNSR